MNLFYEIAPSAGLIFFFTVFLWVAFQAYRPNAKPILEQHAFIPLREENND